MTHTYEELHAMTVAQLREVAKDMDNEELRGYSSMHKEDLLKVLCQTLGIEAHVIHQVVGLDKTKVKGEIRELKQQRQAAIDSGDHKELKRIRRQIHRLKRQIRRATV
jgi:DNA polymerase/3'-5' exonuclease PolX